MTVSSGHSIARPRPSALPGVTASAAILGLGAIAWWWTVGESRAMSSMEMGLAQAGRAMTFDMSTAEFLGMWATMMVAMMLPSVAPHALAFVHGRARVAVAGSIAAFVSGYFVVWAVTGAPALVALTALSRVDHPSAWLDRAGGAMLVVAGAYELTRWKQASLRATRVALGAPSASAAQRDAVAATRAGLRQGVCCLGCCWALIAVLFAVGVMNLVWIAALAVICFAEKNWRHGTAVTTMVGVALVGLGLAVLLHPQFLVTLS